MKRMMTLRHFEAELQKVNPLLRIREGGYGESIAGLFYGDQYLFRLSKGEIPLMTEKRQIITGMQPRMQHGKIYEEPIYKNIIHRGRMQALDLLVNYRHITRRQSQEILWGIYD